jgi:putative nucleotidyltransferase with HDIG domain
VIDQQQVLERVTQLPTMPVAVAALSELIKKPEARAQEFVDVIKPDLALTANVLRLCNSAYFGLSREVTSVRQAFTLLGTKRIFEIAATAAYAKILPPVISGYEIDAQVFWTHSVAVAALSERLSEELKLQASDLTFTAGLLHDIGKLVLGIYLQDVSGEVSDRLHSSDRALVEVERELLETDHGALGALVADHWQLPKTVGWGARWHHEPLACPEDVDRTLVDLIHTADGLSHTLGLGADGAELSRTVEPEVVSRLRISPASLDRVASETLPEIIELSQRFAENL